MRYNIAKKKTTSVSSPIKIPIVHLLLLLLLLFNSMFLLDHFDVINRLLSLIFKQ